MLECFHSHENKYFLIAQVLAYKSNVQMLFLRDLGWMLSVNTASIGTLEFRFRHWNRRRRGFHPDPQLYHHQPENKQKWRHILSQQSWYFRTHEAKSWVSHRKTKLNFRNLQKYFHSKLFCHIWSMRLPLSYDLFSNFLFFVYFPNFFAHCLCFMHICSANIINTVS